MFLILHKIADSHSQKIKHVYKLSAFTHTCLQPFDVEDASDQQKRRRAQPHGAAVSKVSFIQGFQSPRYCQRVIHSHIQNVSWRWYHSVCYWLRPRHSCSRPCLRIRTVRPPRTVTIGSRFRPLRLVPAFSLPRIPCQSPIGGVTSVLLLERTSLRSPSFPFSTTTSPLPRSPKTTVDAPHRFPHPLCTYTQNTCICQNLI